MPLYLFVLAPGLVVSWLIYRRRNSWLATILSIILGVIASYGVIYYLGNYGQVHLHKEMENVLGPSATREFLNALYGRALLLAAGVISVVAVGTKLRTKSKM